MKLWGKIKGWFKKDVPREEVKEAVKPKDVGIPETKPKINPATKLPNKDKK